MKVDDFISKLTQDCLYAGVRKLNRIVTSIYDKELQRLRLTANQLTILAVIGRSVSISAGRVATVLAMDKSTVSRNVERMKRHGWVYQVPDPDDQRIVVFKLTGAGRKLVAGAQGPWSVAQKKVSKLLGDEGTALLKKKF